MSEDVQFLNYFVLFWGEYVFFCFHCCLYLNIVIMMIGRVVPLLLILLFIIVSDADSDQAQVLC